MNRCPTRSLEDMVPEQAWTGKKPNLKFLKVFGSSVMVHIPKVRRQKFDPKSRRGIFVGYCEDTKGYRVYDPEKGDFLISRDVVAIGEGSSNSSGVCEVIRKSVEFMELHFVDATQPELPVEREIVLEDIARDGRDEDGQIEVGHEAAPAEEPVEALVDCHGDALPPQLNRPAEEQQGLRRSGRERRVPGKYNDFNCYGTFSGQDISPQSSTTPPMESSIVELDDPKSYEEVLQRADRDRWIVAMQEEMNSLSENKTWVLADLPDGRKAIRNKWVFKTKRGPSGEVQRYKARLVVKGCSQRPGVDYDEVYSPVVRYATVRYLMALSVKYNLDIDQMDAVTAFLQGELNDEEIYMLQPEGFVKAGGRVCRLKRALYGLKQSSRVWNTQLDAALQDFGLHRSAVDPCLYWSFQGDKLLFVTIYVDDFLIFTNDLNMKQKLKANLNRRFKMKDLGQASHCLGIRITRNREDGKLWLDQQAYVEDIVKRFGMADCYPVAMPAEPSLRLDKTMSPGTKEEAEEMQKVPYKEAVGCLSFAAQVTRPDIAFAVNMVSQFAANPGKQHWEAVKRIFRYLKGTASKKLEYSKEGADQIRGYTDADWGGDPDDRRSTTGYVFTLQGGAISWNVKKQPTVALSSCEAEYMALSRTIQEAMWWNNLRAQMFKVEPVDLYCDNQSAIAIASNGSYNPRTKHVSIRYHFVHESLQHGLVKLGYISTSEQPADGFTKPMNSQKQTNLCKAIGVSD